MIDQDDWNRLARFAAGECSADEADAIARWVGEATERQEALAFVRGLDVAAEAGQPQWDTNASWDRLVVRRRTRVRPPLQLIPLGTGRWRLRWPGLVAAAAALVLGAGVLAGVWRYRQTAAPGHVIGDGPLASGMREYVTRRGQRVALQLPDGTPVILAAASRLRYPASFGATMRREVYLEGQALFHVQHDARRPFVVRTAHGVTEDLGTKFTVQEYDGDTTVQVVVAEGSVELRRRGRAGAGALLRPGQLGRLARNGDAIVQSGVDLTRYLAWTQGRLVFEDTPLRDALPQLSRWYDLDFVLGDSTIGTRHLTATVAGEAIAETLLLLSSTLDISYERHGRTVTFLPRRHR